MGGGVIGENTGKEVEEDGVLFMKQNEKVSSPISDALWISLAIADCMVQGCDEEPSSRAGD